MRSEEFWTFFDTVRERLAHRADTFALIFQRLDQIDRPVLIIETGCTREAGNWTGDGCSTVLFDRYARAHSGTAVLSVDINPAATAACRSLVGESVSIHTGDSVKFLQTLADSGAGLESPDLLYLDSYDFDRENPIPSAAHHLMELVAIAPRLRTQTMVVVDDAFVSLQGFMSLGGQLMLMGAPSVGGKARFIAEYAAHVGAECIFSSYQCGWVKMRSSA